MADASLKRGWVAASLLISQLENATPQDPLAHAQLNSLGATTYIANRRPADICDGCDARTSTANRRPDATARVSGDKH